MARSICNRVCDQVVLFELGNFSEIRQITTIHLLMNGNDSVMSFKYLIIFMHNLLVK